MNGTEFIASLPETPGAQRDELTLAAVEEGSYVIEWSELTFSDADNELVIEVSSDVLRIGEPDDCVRVAVTAQLQQRIADELECLMPTALISDACWLNGKQLNVYGQTQDPDGAMAYTSRFVKMSQVLDKQIGDTKGLVAPCGKDWVLASVLWLSYNAGRAANYGWQLKSGANPGETKGVRVIQNVVRSIQLPHGSSHTDYSQLCRLVKRSCKLNGKPADLADILMDENLAHLVSSDGPLPGYRQPDVPFPTTAMAPSDPGAPMPPWKDPMRTLGERALEFSKHEKRKGVTERPKRSNSGPEIAEYFRPATRIIKGKEVRLGISSGNWCSVSACAATWAALLEDEEAPHGYRAGVVELVEDAQKNGSYRPVSMVRDGSWTPKVGDLAILDRSVPGRPETAWWRHVARVETPLEAGMYRTLGGNEAGDQYQITERKLKSPRLLGFIAYPQEVPEAAWPDEQDPVEARRLVDLSDAVMRGDFGLEAALEDFEDDDEWFDRHGGEGIA